MVLAVMNSKGVHDLVERDKLVRDISTKCGGAQRRFYLGVSSELKASLPLLC